MLLAGYGDARFVLRDLDHLYGIGRTFGKRSSILDKFLHDHANDVVHVAQCFLRRASRSRRADAFERGTIGKPRRIAVGVLVRLPVAATCSPLPLAGPERLR